MLVFDTGHRKRIAQRHHQLTQFEGFPFLENLRWQSVSSRPALERGQLITEPTYLAASLTRVCDVVAVHGRLYLLCGRIHLGRRRRFGQPAVSGREGRDGVTSHRSAALPLSSNCGCRRRLLLQRLLLPPLSGYPWVVEVKT